MARTKDHDDLLSPAPSPASADEVVVENDGNPITYPVLRLTIERGRNVIAARGTMSARERWEALKATREAKAAIKAGTLRGP